MTVNDTNVKSSDYMHPTLSHASDHDRGIASSPYGRPTWQSMTNVARHSGAEHCSVEIIGANGDLRVGVTDDGNGYASPRPMGHGLDSMRRRALDVGGRLTVATIEPHGTAVAAVLPLEKST